MEPHYPKITKAVEEAALARHRRLCWVGPWCPDYTMEDVLAVMKEDEPLTLPGIK